MTQPVSCWLPLTGYLFFECQLDAARPIMFALIPYRINVLLQRWPVGNFILIGLCILFFVLSGIPSYQDFLDCMVLTHWSAAGLIGYQFLHGGRQWCGERSGWVLPCHVSGYTFSAESRIPSTFMRE
jgi:hypothetical protein